MRKIISIFIAVLLLLGSIFLAKYLIDNKQKPKPRFNKVVKTVFTQEVNNTTIPLYISTNGSLVAKNKIDLYSEVQGILVKTSKEFKSGTKFYKGETLVKLNSDEFYANLKAQKSNLYNVLTSIMPDIRLDYASEYEKWQNYLTNFDINKSVTSLPKTNSEKEKYFISGRGVLTSYYNVKNLEVKLGKYNLKAPFKGILTETMVNPGTLVRPGQKLGEFIDPSVYEMGVSIKSEFKDLLQIGKEVKLSNLENTKNWTGKVVRINGKVDGATQTLKVFIEVNGNDLKEGQYLEVALNVKSEENAFEISRKLLVDNSKLYVVKDTLLELIDIQLIFENRNSVVIKGLENGTLILAKPVPGAHSGMLVKIFNENDPQ